MSLCVKLKHNVASFKLACKKLQKYVNIYLLCYYVFNHFHTLVVLFIHPNSDSVSLSLYDDSEIMFILHIALKYSILFAQPQ